MIRSSFELHARCCRRGQRLWATGFLLLLTAGTCGAAEIRSGAEVYSVSCSGCHATGVLQAPKLGDNADWSKRELQGLEVLLEHALKGYKNMPARGGNPTIKDQEIENAIIHMLVSSGIENYTAKPVPAETEKTVATAASVADRKPVPQARSSSVNSFNRLMKSKEEWNLPPPKDGIHDPKNEGTHMLQSPRAAFEFLVSAKSGNRVDWVKALEKGEIAPRYDRLDPEVKPVVMDLNIVREVKGSMPDVVYPHKQHTEWLDCSNCHPAIFIPQKGANQISMASILLGQKCGVCHGKVAFPVSECRRCHSQQKPDPVETVNKQIN
ncbi:MAG TPA: c(7)-type cytochrome triheme domain-containing protein [Gammaproteobacteria bacterium]|nr:c(7)-type cytochrome triheme domain-containing protein [Gammaproteobacteria bacterium]